MILTPGSLRAEDWIGALNGGDYAEIFLEESRGAAVSLEDGAITEITDGADQGAGLRYLTRGERSDLIETVHGAVNSLDPAACRAVTKNLLRGRESAPAPKPAPVQWYPQPHLRHPFDVPMDDKVALLQRIDRVIRGEYPLVTQVQLSYAERAKRFAILDSEGDYRLGERISVVFIVSVTASKDGVLQTGYEVIGGLKGYEILTEYDPLRVSRRAAQAAVDKLSAPVAPAGEMPVVLASSAGGTFVHEAIGHSLEADHVQEGTSPHYADKIGATIANEFLTIVDDPTLPFARGSFAFDDEGLPAQATTLVENGVLKDYLYDRNTAMREGKKSNGHGRRESFRHRPIPRMSNLYIAPGKDDPARIIRELDKGLLVTKMGGGEVNTATGEFVFGVEEGYWVEGGKVHHRVRDANMLGVGPDVLRSIDRLGWDIGWGVGTCGKQGQGVPVSDGQPTLRIPKLLIGGRQKG